ncbi:hypothetical protein EOL70_10820 [Leucothrix sargassi]|nr:hypothetical protein EOL70_10820 [Leucothrix sargassi]
MSLLSSIKSLFSSSDAAPKIDPAKIEEYGGFEIIPMPQKEGGQYRLNGIIRKGDQEHQLIRADTFSSPDECSKEVLRKGRLLIDQMGDRLFG